MDNDEPIKVSKDTQLFVKEIATYGKTKIDKIKGVLNSLKNQQRVEAKKEFNKQLRYIFEKATPETVPFLVYCIYVGATGMISFLFILTKYEGNMLYIIIGLLIFTLILPLCLLPKTGIKSFIIWLKFWKKKDNESKS